MIVPWQKPFRGTPINPAHPMARGLAAAYPFNEATGEVVHNYITHAVAPVDVVAGGWAPGGLYLDGAELHVQVQDTSIPASKTMRAGMEFTVFVWADLSISSVSSATHAVMTSRTSGPAGGWACKAKQYGSSYVGFTYRGVADYVFNQIAAQSGRHIYSWRVKDGDYCTLRMDGTQQTISIGSCDLTNTPTGLSVGCWYVINDKGDQLTDDRTPGVYNVAYFWDRLLTDDEMDLLYRDPYCMFRQPPDIGAFEYAEEGGSGPKWNTITPAKWNGVDWGNLKWNGM